MFFVRQAVERCVVERLCSSMSKDGVKRLRDHVKNERIANAEDSTTDIIKLSGGFHLLLAELTGSDFLFTTMRDLIARSSLIRPFTGTPRASIAVRTSMPTSLRRLRRKRPKEPSSHVASSGTCGIRARLERDTRLFARSSRSTGLKRRKARIVIYSKMLRRGMRAENRTYFPSSRFR